MGARRFAKIAAMGALAPALAAAISLAIRPDLRHALTALLNDPEKLPAFESDARIRFEPAAQVCAEAVAAILPDAIARIESEHGRPFAKPPVVGVYNSFGAYARANGLGEPNVAGVSRAGRALLSPALCDSERYRLAGVLTHELSHVHLFGWRPRRAPRPPQWFTEGLAVMVSDGGAAEGVSDAQAAQTIRDGFRIVPDERPWMLFSAIRFEKEPPVDPALGLATSRQRLAYRQAALFVGWLRARDADGFSQLLRRLERGDGFDAAFAAALGATPGERWRDFVAGLSANPPKAP